jgi:hypothetical protein
VPSTKYNVRSRGELDYLYVGDRYFGFRKGNFGIEPFRVKGIKEFIKDKSDFGRLMSESKSAKKMFTRSKPRSG